jgi:sugar lactone lactonase YvrE
MTIIGSGDYRYEKVEGWPKMPRYWKFGDANDVAVNSKDEVHVFNRGKHPLTVWTPDGDFITSWGEGAFTDFTHGIFISPNDNVWLVDSFGQYITEFTPDGQGLRTLGTPGQPSPAFLGKPFNIPTALAMSPNGDIFVSDGYGNHRVHKFNAKGELLFSWGKEGKGPGEFVNVHNVAVDRQGRVYICDRENLRIQIFDDQGKFINEWTGLSHPMKVYIYDNLAYVAEASLSLNAGFSIWTLDGKRLMRHFTTDGSIKGAHGICVDSTGSVYVSEIVYAQKVHKFIRV